jgi:uncharacterized protein (TIGR03083 family)
MGKEMGMAAIDAYVPLVHTEADGLAQFLDTLSADQWQRPSACDLWTIRDVVAHLIWAADFYTDAVSRGIHGDISHPKDRPPGNAPALFQEMPAYIDQQARTVRDRVGESLLPTFRSGYRALAQLMAPLSPQQWEMPCAFFQFRGGHRPASAFLFAILAELAIHGWDMRSRFDETASLSEQSMQSLLEWSLPTLVGFITFPVDTGSQSPVRYRFDLEGERNRRYDVIVEEGKGCLELAADTPAEVTLRCDRSTFALLLYSRFTLEAAVAQGRVSVEGDHALAQVLAQSLTPYFSAPRTPQA